MSCEPGLYSVLTNSFIMDVLIAAIFNCLSTAIDMMLTGFVITLKSPPRPIFRQNSLPTPAGLHCGKQLLQNIVLYMLQVCVCLFEAVMHK